MLSNPLWIVAHFDAENVLWIIDHANNGEQSAREFLAGYEKRFDQVRFHLFKEMPSTLADSKKEL